MFPFIKLTMHDGDPIWVRYDTIAQVYYDHVDNYTYICNTAEEGDFKVRESVDEIINKLKAFYPDSKYQHSSAENINKLINTSYLDLL